MITQIIQNLKHFFNLILILLIILMIKLFLVKYHKEYNSYFLLKLLLL